MNTNKETAEALIARAEKAVEAGDYDEAERLAEEVLAAHPTQTLPRREGFSETPSPDGEGWDGVSSSFPTGEGRDGVLVERGEMDIKGKGRMKTYFLEKQL